MICDSCGKELVDVAVVCMNCGAPTKNYKAPLPSPQALELDSSAKYCLPLGVSIWALAAGYLALFSVLLLPAPFALLSGVMALRDIRRNPSKRGLVRAWLGVAMGALFSLLLLLLAFAFVMDAFVKGHWNK